MTDVLIAGAGPSGLVLALWLARRGVSVRVIDKLGGPSRYSRAIAVHARTLEYYRMLGIVDRIVPLGLKAPELKVRVNGKIKVQLVVGEFGKGLSRYPYILFLSQEYHEKALRAELEHYGVHVEWGHELLSFEQNDAGVAAQVRRGAETELVEATYLVGADGAHSIVRHGIGAGFDGHTNGAVNYVADVDLDGKRDATLEVCLGRDALGAVMPISGQSSVRLLGLVPKEAGVDGAMTFEDASAFILSQTGYRVKNVNWFSTYNVHHRVASTFRNGRAFIIGDAGHVHSPAGGQGMNTGIGDATNLGWKLGAVIMDGANPELLDSFEPERIAFARELIHSTDQGFSLGTERSWRGALVRQIAIPYFMGPLFNWPVLQHVMFGVLSQTRITYRQSPLSSPERGKVRSGDRLPFCQVGAVDNHSVLDGYWQVHHYRGDGTPLSYATDLPVPAHNFPYSPEARQRGLRAGKLYVVRPDGHVGGIFDNVDDVRAWLRTWAGLGADA